jgi:hypothetical protein
MSGGTTTTQNQQQNSTTNPWAPAVPAVTGLLNNISSNSTAPNASQTSAISQLENNANTATNFGQPAANVTSSLLSGGNPAYTGILNSGYSTLQSNLNPIANGSALGNNSALNTQLATIANDTQNSVGSQFAAAGRSMSPGEAQAIARGTAQGEAPVLANQYNTNLSNQLAANNQLYGAANSTATGLNSMTTGNETAGLNAATMYPGILNQNATSLLNAGNAEQQLPYQGTGLAESQLLPIAGLGASSTGTSSGTTTQQQPLGPTLLGGILGGSSLLGSGGLNVLGSLGTALMGMSGPR